MSRTCVGLFSYRLKGMTTQHEEVANDMTLFYVTCILLNVVLISCPKIANSSRGTPGITRYSASHTSISHELWS